MQGQSLITLTDWVSPPSVENATCDYDAVNLFPPTSRPFSKSNKNNLITIPVIKHLCSTKDKFLKVWYTNAQSARPGDRLKTQSLHNAILESDSDIAFITETWFCESGDEVHIQQLRPPGFAEPRSIPRTSGQIGGGLLMVCKDGLKFQQKTILDFKSFEACQFTFSFEKRDILFVCIYRPTPNKENKLTPRMFLDDFSCFLDLHSFNRCELIILGDFNLHYDDPSQTYAKEMITLLSNRSLVQIIDKPTQRKEHILDWVVKREDDCNIHNVEVLDKCISDHSVITFHLNISKPQVVKKQITSRNLF